MNQQPKVRGLHRFEEDGVYVIIVKSNRTIRKKMDEDLAPMMAIGAIVEDKIAEYLVQYSTIKLPNPCVPLDIPLTESQKKAWDNLIKEFGNDARWLERPSAREIAEKTTESIMKESLRLMKNETVKKAFEQYLTISKLTKQKEMKE